MKLQYSLYFLILIFIIGCSGGNPVEKEKIETKQINEVVNMKLTSSAFEHQGSMPSEFTCDGAGISPPLTISEVPENTKSIALVSDDPDAPAGTWVHWVVWNIPPDTTEMPKGTEPQGVQGKTDFGRTGYGAPCPPSGTHRYFFKLYALDTELELQEGSSKSELEGAMEGHIIEKAELIGTYKRLS